MIKNSFLTLGLLFSGITLNAQKINTVTSEKFHYRGLGFVESEYSTVNCNKANKIKSELKKNPSKQIWYTDTMCATVSLTDFYTYGPKSEVLNPAMRSIRDIVFLGPKAKTTTSLIPEDNQVFFEDHCLRVSRGNLVEFRRGIQVSDTLANWLSINAFLEEDAGGAHPQHAHQNFLLEMNSGKLWKFNEVFEPQKIALLKAALYKKFLSQYKKDDLLGDFTVTENISLNRKGFSFNYNPYEITPYAMGDPILELSIPQAWPYLTSAFKKEMVLIFPTMKEDVKPTPAPVKNSASKSKSGR